MGNANIHGHVHRRSKWHVTDFYIWYNQKYYEYASNGNVHSYPNYGTGKLSGSYVHGTSNG